MNTTYVQWKLQDSHTENQVRLYYSKCPLRQLFSQLCLTTTITTHQMHVLVQVPEHAAPFFSQTEEGMRWENHNFSPPSKHLQAPETFPLSGWSRDVTVNSSEDSKLCANPVRCPVHVFLLRGKQFCWEESLNSLAPWAFFHEDVFCSEEISLPVETVWQTCGSKESLLWAICSFPGSIPPIVLSVVKSKSMLLTCNSQE